MSYDDKGWNIGNCGNAEVRFLAKTFRLVGINDAANFMSMVSGHCHVLNQPFLKPYTTTPSS